MQKKKVLIITYYWPPSAGVGVQRWLKFSKYLPEFGWLPTVITPENPQFQVSDATLEVNPAVIVHQLPIWEPFEIFSKISGGKKKDKVKQGLVLEGQKKSTFERAAIWLRGNVFLPDPRIFWKKTVISFLQKHLKSHSYDLLVTTGPPHSMHLIGLEAAEKFGFRWVADFRDPWSRWDILPELNTSALAMKRHISWERQVLQTADAVLCTSRDQGEMFTQLGAKHVEVITNGFDVDDMPDLISISPDKSTFTMAHIGLLNELRNPEHLWQALEEILRENELFAQKFRLQLGGIVGQAVTASLEKFPLLKQKTEVQNYIPHKEMLRMIAATHLLLIVQNKSASAPLIIPAKLFEYLAVGRPILMIGPDDCHAAEILNQSNAGKAVSHENKKVMKEFIMQIFEKSHFTKSAKVDLYQRRELTRQLTIFFNQIVNVSN